MLVDEVMRTRRNRCKSIVSMWEQTYLLNRTEDYLKPELAMCLETQRIFNENVDENDDSVGVKIFKKLSIPLVTRFFNNLKIKELVSVQTLAGPTDKVHYLNGTELIEDSIIARPKLCKTLVPWNNGDVGSELSQETRWAEDVSRNFINEVQDEIFTDLVNNALVYESDISSAAITKAIEFVEFRREITPNWIVMSPAVASKFLLSSEFSESNLRSVGFYKGLRAYAYDEFAENQILMGYSELYKSHYVYSPYILLNQLAINENKFGLMRRYGKRLGDKHGYVMIKGGN